MHRSTTQVKNRTDQMYQDYQAYDLSGNGWNNRFHVQPSAFNGQNHTYYKQFFDKPSKTIQDRVLRPRKTLDPYLKNEFENRIPKYSKVYSKQTRAKEMQWVDNFAVKCSKDNARIHRKFKEFFDRPRDYEGNITVGKSKGQVRRVEHLNQYARQNYSLEDETEKNKYRASHMIMSTIDKPTQIPFL